MIYTVTLNPALDYVLSAKTILPGQVNRASKADMTFGGKGINQSILTTVLLGVGLCGFQILLRRPLALVFTGEEAVIATDWFDDEVVATKHVDFFVKRSINYSKRTRSITADDLF